MALVSHLLVIERQLKIAAWERAKAALGELYMMQGVVIGLEGEAIEAHDHKMQGMQNVIAAFIKEMEGRGFTK